MPVILEKEVTTFTKRDSLYEINLGNNLHVTAEVLFTFTGEGGRKILKSVTNATDIPQHLRQTKSFLQIEKGQIWDGANFLKAYFLAD